MKTVSSWARRARGALHQAMRFASIDGEHHNKWVIDQMVRALCGGVERNDEFSKTDEYNAWVRAFCSGEDGPATYEWNDGIAP